MSLHTLSARQIADQVQAGTRSAVSVAQACLKRAEALNPTLNALTYLNPKLPEEAAAVDALIAGGAVLPLAGVPVVIKDNIWVQGMPITQGSRLFADFIAPQDAIAVARLRAAGAVILGIGTCSEFACKGVTNTPLHGITRHPANTGLTPGGSSGGCASVVAAGIVPLALGTDAGGSSRRPPAHVGIVGFKPTQDAIPYGPGFAESSWGISTVCPIARTVEDAALMFGVLSGQTVVGEAADTCCAYALTLGLDAAIDGDVARVCDRAVGAITQVTNISKAAPIWPQAVDVASLMPLQFAGLAALYGTKWQTSPDLFDPDIGAQIKMGLTLSGIDVARALECSRQTRETLRAFLDVHGFLITATTPCPAWPVTQLGPAQIGGKQAGPRDHALFTPQANHAGVPAITIPCGHTDSGLPVGLQVIGRAGSDAKLLALASRFEIILKDLFVEKAA
jgi:aspartyl-tRNA(Asn)/glutamyl-tRNA(Gln) amidotransferase subunit A